MTFRAKPPRRRPTSPHEDEARRERFVTIGFIGVTLAAVLILVGYFAYGYYQAHFAVIAAVDGTDITVDQWRAQVAVDDYKLDLFERRVREQLRDGNLTREIASAYDQSIRERRQQIASAGVDELIDAALQAKLADDLAVTVSEADIDAAIAEAATSPEERHVLVIGIDPLLVGSTPSPGETPAPTETPTASPSAAPTPTPSPTPAPTSIATPAPTSSPPPGATEPTSAQLAQARAEANEALARLQAGDNFGDVALQYSTDSSGPTGGDLGFIVKDQAPDEALGEALFAMSAPGTTAVIEGKGHVLWIGRMTELRPAQKDLFFLDDLEQLKVDRAAYRASVAADVRRQKITDALIAQVGGGEDEQVHAYEILVKASGSQPDSNEAEVHVRHILFSPNDDSAAAQSLPEDDPAWQKAQEDANKAADTLRAIPDAGTRELTFEQLARSDSDDTTSGPQGGDLGWLTRASLEQPFGDAVFDGAHANGEIIGPVKTVYGWHVILYLESRAGARDRIDAIRSEVTTPGADFSEIARQKSEGADASSGGDMGWIARYQLDPDAEKALFELKAGEVSDVISDSSGLHLYYVAERTPRGLDADQVQALKSSALDHWYEPLKTAAKIYRNTDLLASLGA